MDTVHEWGDPGRLTRVRHPPRVTVSSERLRIDALLPEDAGLYRCIVTHNTHSAFRDIRVIVEKPAIAIYALEVIESHASQCTVP